MCSTASCSVTWRTRARPRIRHEPRRKSNSLEGEGMAEEAGSISEACVYKSYKKDIIRDFDL